MNSLRSIEPARADPTRSSVSNNYKRSLLQSQGQINMISLNNFTRSTLLFSAIALSSLISNPVNAKEFKIGGVKQQF
jgi:hypothetical protein